MSRSLQDGESIRLVDDVIDSLRSKLDGYVELRGYTSSLSTTIVSMYRFRKDYRDERGPKPLVIAQAVPGLWKPVTAKLQPIGLWGRCLSFELDSPEMVEQEQLYAAEFKTLGYELKGLIGERQFEYKPHLSFGSAAETLLQDDQVIKQKLEALNAAIEPYFGEVLVFKPAFTNQEAFTHELNSRHLPPR